jgi:hypothetical protein
VKDEGILRPQQGLATQVRFALAWGCEYRSKAANLFAGSAACKVFLDATTAFGDAVTVCANHAMKVRAFPHCDTLESRVNVAAKRRS